MRPSEKNDSKLSGPVTLRDVAESAGVSVSTASRALSGNARKYRISVSTEEAVSKVAAELGFQPSSIARSLRLQRSETIGVIFPDISNPFFAAIAREISLGTESQGYSVLIGDSREDTQNEKRLALQLRARQIDALLVCPVGIESNHLVELGQTGLPLVVVDRVFENTDLYSVTSDNYAAAIDVAQLLVDYGHRKIGVLNGIQNSSPTQTRIDGLRKVTGAAGFAVEPSYIEGNAFTEQSGYDATKKLLSRHPDITAVFSMCSTIAIGALQALRELGLRVPQDVSVVTFDDQPFAELLETPLTSSIQDTEMLGRRATEMLMQRLDAVSTVGNGSSVDGAPDDVKLVKVPTKLVQRKSVAASRN